MALGVGLVLGAIGLSGIALPDLGRKLGVWLPLCLTIGFALLAYAELSWPRFRRREAEPPPQPARQLRTFLLVGLALMSLFWTVALYADQMGRQVARSITRDLADRTEVVIYAKQRLALSGPGVEVVALGLADSKYQYRYSGLRLRATRRPRRPPRVHCAAIRAGRHIARLDWPIRVRLDGWTCRDHRTWGLASRLPW